MKDKKKEGIKSLRENPMTTKEAFHRSQLTLLKMRKKLEEKSKKSK